jgi:hypothetical protein
MSIFGLFTVRIGARASFVSLADKKRDMDQRRLVVEEMIYQGRGTFANANFGVSHIDPHTLNPASLVRIRPSCQQHDEETEIV